MYATEPPKIENLGNAEMELSTQVPSSFTYEEIEQKSDIPPLFTFKELEWRPIIFPQSHVYEELHSWHELEWIICAHIQDIQARVGTG